MPIHDWTRGHPGMFHDQHLGWTARLVGHFNNGGLPSGFYAMSEFTTADGEPPDFDADKDDSSAYAARRRRVVIRREIDDAATAVVETATPGDRRTAAAVGRFTDGVRASIARGVNVLLIDVFPPVPFVPAGMPGAVSAALGLPVEPAIDTGPAVAVYTAAPLSVAVERLTVDDPMPAPWLWVAVDRRIRAPLEASYMEAYAGFPRQLKPLIEGKSAA